MAERSERHGLPGERGTTGWAGALDDGPLWPRLLHGRCHPGRLAWRRDLDRALADLHARYERACMEE